MRAPGRNPTGSKAFEAPSEVLSAVVAVPVYRPVLEAEERVSWRHLIHHLGHLDIRLFLPEGIENPLPAIEAVRFPARFFESVATYSRLLMSEDFYRRFDRWEFLLVYQLDALVFSPHLGPWCAAGYDYLGAPWWHDPERPDLGLSRVGNGGLSLRRVAAFLSVLTSTRRPPWSLPGASPVPDLEALPPLQRWRRRCRIQREARRGVHWYSGHYTHNEDHFWSDRAALFDPAFRIAPAEEALAFSFEVAPEACYARCGRRLPFGCHGWWRYGREFWLPYLLPDSERPLAGDLVS